MHVIIFIFLIQYLGFFANSVDPDQTASSVDMKMTCFHLLKVASDGNSYLLFGEHY